MENKNSILQETVNVAFLISISYWIYLLLTTRMAIVFDAIEYESLGKMLSEQGWIEFFKTGPIREPFYPALIAFSMKLGKMFSFPYQFIQVLIQLLILFLTQILTLRILKLLKINNLLSALTILYMGISPAIVNSALSLFSEIATYPLILIIVFSIYKSWLSFTGARNRVILLAVVTSLSFVIIVSIKGIFELVTPLLIFLILVTAFSTRNRKLISNALIYLTVFFVVFYSLISVYKLINKNFNGHFTVRERGPEILYLDTTRRMEPMNGERFLTVLTSTPGAGLCKSIFGELKCHCWDCWDHNGTFLKKVEEMKKSNMPREERNKTFVMLSKQKILQNPAQYILLIVLEGAKMFFWESTQIGFVAYPAGLTKLFAIRPLNNGLRLGMSFLTLFAILYLIVLLYRERNNFLKADSPLLFLFLSLLFIFSFVAPYTIFCTITRYYLSIAPLFLIIIAYIFQNILASKVKMIS